MDVRKLFCAAVMVVCVSFAVNAQISPNAIGLRGVLVSKPSSGFEVNYQRAVSDKNRLEFGALWDNSSYERYDTKFFGGFAGYHRHYNVKGGFNSYLGPGAYAGYQSLSYDTDYYSGSKSDKTYFGIGGQMGIEYNFNVFRVPLLLSFDLRMFLETLPLFKGECFFCVVSDFSLGIRYTF